MGTFNVDLWVGSLFAEEGATVSALVDTGATNTVLPASLLHGLGIEPVETRFARVADGRRVELQTAWARFSVPGRNAVARVAFGPEGQYLMGATTLEDLALVVDPVDQRLIEQEDLLMRGEERWPKN
ncbi:MAG: aspartyl protease family protein [Chloroflexi bacterium]|nr:aspartyl protease family protein [Chloroflexota bacterium]